LRLPQVGTIQADSIRPGEVHVWKASLDVDDAARTSARRLLSREENRRSLEFFDPVASGRFVVGRGILRSILGRYTGTRPEEVKIHAGGSSKPSLGAHAPLKFNLTHSGGVALVAVSVDREVGIDLETEVLPDEAYMLGKRFLGEGAGRRLDALEASFRTRYFGRCWTQREALLKARGLGLDSIEDVAMGIPPPGDRSVFLVEAESRHGATRWHFHELEVGPNLSTTLAVEGGRCRLVDPHEMGTGLTTPRTVPGRPTDVQRKGFSHDFRPLDLAT